MSAGQGHNSEGVAGAQLRTVVERIERLEEEVRELNADKSDVYKEAKSNGFDPKIVKKVVALRRRSAAEAQEEDALLDLYLSALAGTDDATRARSEAGR